MPINWDKVTCEDVTPTPERQIMLPPPPANDIKFTMIDDCRDRECPDDECGPE